MNEQLMPQSTLVVAATVAEARHVPENFSVLITGIGKVKSGVSIARALAEYRHGEVTVVNIGTAGGLRPSTGGVCVPSRVLDHELPEETLRAMGYEVPGQLPLEDGDGTVLATGDAFVADTVLRDRIAKRADLVDMEGYAVAWACQEQGVRCRIVKHISDTADEQAVIDWPKQVDRSARALGAWLAQRCVQ